MSDRQPTADAPIDELGAVFLEYGLMITLVGLTVAVALLLFGPAVAALFDDPALLDWLTP